MEIYPTVIPHHSSTLRSLDKVIFVHHVRNKNSSFCIVGESYFFKIMHYNIALLHKKVIVLLSYFLWEVMHYDSLALHFVT